MMRSLPSSEREKFIPQGDVGGLFYLYTLTKPLPYFLISHDQSKGQRFAT